MKWIEPLQQHSKFRCEWVWQNPVALYHFLHTENIPRHVEFKRGGLVSLTLSDLEHVGFAQIQTLPLSELKEKRRSSEEE